MSGSLCRVKKDPSFLQRLALVQREQCLCGGDGMKRKICFRHIQVATTTVSEHTPVVHSDRTGYGENARNMNECACTRSGLGEEIAGKELATPPNPSTTPISTISLGRGVPRGRASWGVTTATSSAGFRGRAREKRGNGLQLVRHSTLLCCGPVIFTLVIW